MGDLKPLGSEKLKVDEKLKRILELTYYKDNNSKSNTSKPDLVKESTNGSVYGVVREKDGYYVKKGLNESSLDYIGGMFMKNKNKFSSYAEALKRLELLKGQDELNEATKYVLKTSKPKEEAPMPEPTMGSEPAPEMGSEPAPEMGSEPAPEMGSSEMGSEPSPEGDMSSPEMDSETPSPEGEGKRSDYMAEVQKYAGKLGQELRDLHDKMESDDIKYVLNMIISAVDLEKLDLEDLEDIAEKFEREEEEGIPSEEPSSDEEDMPSDETEVPAEEPSAEGDLGETDDPMSKLEEFIDTPIQSSEIDLSKYARLGMGENSMEEDVVELDMNEIQSAINRSVAETLGKYFK
jgi:hypothetical protein